jgi:hypothetical protein
MLSVTYSTQKSSSKGISWNAFRWAALKADDLRASTPVRRFGQNRAKNSSNIRAAGIRVNRSLREGLVTPEIADAFDGTP